MSPEDVSTTLLWQRSSEDAFRAWRLLAPSWAPGDIQRARPDRAVAVATWAIATAVTSGATPPDGMTAAMRTLPDMTTRPPGMPTWEWTELAASTLDWETATIQVTELARRWYEADAGAVEPPAMEVWQLPSCFMLLELPEQGGQVVACPSCGAVSGNRLLWEGRLVWGKCPHGHLWAPRAPAPAGLLIEQMAEQLRGLTGAPRSTLST